MSGMGFLTWFWLTVIALVVSILMYYVFRKRLAGGYWSQLIIGWIGAWLGSPVFGHWLWHYGRVYFIPAILGSIALIWLIKSAEKVLK